MLPDRINLLHIYCGENNYLKLRRALSKGFPLMTSTTNKHPLLIAIESNSVNCVEEILEYLCSISDSRKFIFENAVKQITHFLPKLLEYSPNKIKNFCGALTKKVENGISTLGMPIEKLPKIITSEKYNIEEEKFINISKQSNEEQMKFIEIRENVIAQCQNMNQRSKNIKNVPINFYRCSLLWNFTPGSADSLKLLNSINKCRNLGIFKTKFIQDLINLKWNIIWIKVLTLTIIFWLNLLFFTLAVFGIDNRSYFAIALLVVCCSLVIYEVLGMIYSWSNYTSNPMNALDFLIYLGNIVWSICLIGGTIDPLDDELVAITWLLGFANAFRGITFFRTFKLTRFYMRMIIQTIKNTYAFLLILLYSTICFGIISYISMPDNIEGLDTIPESFFTSFSLNLNNFSTPSTLLGYITVIVQSIINVIIIINLLISIIGSSYNAFEQVAEIYNYKEMLEIIIEIESIKSSEETGSKSYIHSCEESIVTDSKTMELAKMFEDFKKENSLVIKKQEDTILAELIKIRSDIGNIYSKLMRSNIK